MLAGCKQIPASRPDLSIGYIESILTWVNMGWGKSGFKKFQVILGLGCFTFRLFGFANQVFRLGRFRFVIQV